jgi:hypothetical protein
VPLRVVRAYLAEEIPAATAHAARSGLALQYDDAALTATMCMVGPPAQAGATPEEYLLHGAFDGYRALPPVWEFLDPRTSKYIGLPAWPKGTGSTVLNGNGIVCAHWSRCAYKTAEFVDGLHGDWGPPSNWRNPNAGQTTAFTVADMLDRLIREIELSSGRMAPLPEVKP